MIHIQRGGVIKKSIDFNISLHTLAAAVVLPLIFKNAYFAWYLSVVGLLLVSCIFSFIYSFFKESFLLFLVFLKKLLRSLKAFKNIFLVLSEDSINFIVFVADLICSYGALLFCFFSFFGLLNLVVHCCFYLFGKGTLYNCADSYLAYYFKKKNNSKKININDVILKSFVVFLHCILFYVMGLASSIIYGDLHQFYMYRGGSGGENLNYVRNLHNIENALKIKSTKLYDNHNTACLIKNFLNSKRNDELYTKLAVYNILNSKSFYDENEVVNSLPKNSFFSSINEDEVKSIKALILKIFLRVLFGDDTNRVFNKKATEMSPLNFSRMGFKKTLVHDLIKVNTHFFGLYYYKSQFMRNIIFSSFKFNSVCLSPVLNSNFFFLRELLLKTSFDKFNYFYYRAGVYAFNDTSRKFDSKLFNTFYNLEFFKKRFLVKTSLIENFLKKNADFKKKSLKTDYDVFKFKEEKLIKGIFKWSHLWEKDIELEFMTFRYIEVLNDVPKPYFYHYNEKWTDYSWQEKRMFWLWKTREFNKLQSFKIKLAVKNLVNLVNSDILELHFTFNFNKFSFLSKSLALYLKKDLPLDFFAYKKNKENFNCLNDSLQFCKDDFFNKENNVLKSEKDVQELIESFNQYDTFFNGLNKTVSSLDGSVGSIQKLNSMVSDKSNRIKMLLSRVHYWRLPEFGLLNFNLVKPLIDLDSDYMINKFNWVTPWELIRELLGFRHTVGQKGFDLSEYDSTDVYIDGKSLVVNFEEDKVNPGLIISSLIKAKKARFSLIREVACGYSDNFKNIWISFFGTEITKPLFIIDLKTFSKEYLASTFNSIYKRQNNVFFFYNYFLTSKSKWSYDYFKLSKFFEPDLFGSVINYFIKTLIFQKNDTLTNLVTTLRFKLKPARFDSLFSFSIKFNQKSLLHKGFLEFDDKWRVFFLKPKSNWFLFSKDYEVYLSDLKRGSVSNFKSSSFYFNLHKSICKENKINFLVGHTFFVDCSLKSLKFKSVIKDFFLNKQNSSLLLKKNFFKSTNNSFWGLGFLFNLQKSKLECVHNFGGHAFCLKKVYLPKFYKSDINFELEDFVTHALILFKKKKNYFYEVNSELQHLNLGCSENFNWKGVFAEVDYSNLVNYFSNSFLLNFKYKNNGFNYSSFFSLADLPFVNNFMKGKLLEIINKSFNKSLIFKFLSEDPFFTLQKTGFFKKFFTQSNDYVVTGRILSLYKDFNGSSFFKNFWEKEFYVVFKLKKFLIEDSKKKESFNCFGINLKLFGYNRIFEKVIFKLNFKIFSRINNSNWRISFCNDLSYINPLFAKFVSGWDTSLVKRACSSMHDVWNIYGVEKILGGSWELGKVRSKTILDIIFENQVINALNLKTSNTSFAYSGISSQSLYVSRDFLSVKLLSNSHKFFSMDGLLFNYLFFFKHSNKKINVNFTNSLIDEAEYLLRFSQKMLDTCEGKELTNKNIEIRGLLFKNFYDISEIDCIDILSRKVDLEVEEDVSLNFLEYIYDLNENCSLFKNSIKSMCGFRYVNWSSLFSKYCEQPLVNSSYYEVFSSEVPERGITLINKVFCNYVAPVSNFAIFKFNQLDYFSSFKIFYKKKFLELSTRTKNLGFIKLENLGFNTVKPLFNVNDDWFNLKFYTLFKNYAVSAGFGLHNAILKGSTLWLDFNDEVMLKNNLLQFDKFNCEFEPNFFEDCFYSEPPNFTLIQSITESVNSFDYVYYFSDDELFNFFNIKKSKSNELSANTEFYYLTNFEKFELFVKENSPLNFLLRLNKKLPSKFEVSFLIKLFEDDAWTNCGKLKFLIKKISLNSLLMLYDRTPGFLKLKRGPKGSIGLPYVPLNAYYDDRFSRFESYTTLQKIVFASKRKIFKTVCVYTFGPIIQQTVFKSASYFLGDDLPIEIREYLWERINEFFVDYIPDPLDILDGLDTFYDNYLDYVSDMATDKAIAAGKIPPRSNDVQAVYNRRKSSNFFHRIAGSSLSSNRQIFVYVLFIELTKYIRKIK